MTARPSLPCPLCLSERVELLHQQSRNLGQRSFFICQVCGLVFLDTACHLSSFQEKARYDLHRNDLSDPRYREYLLKFIAAFKPFLRPGLRGLDFGCGVVPGIARLMEEDGFRMSCYDPYYFPSMDALAQTYDFIACCEVVEHFRDPRREFDLLKRLLNPGGLLAIRTEIYDPSTDFSSWWYPRDPAHVVFYQKSTMQQLAKTLELQITAVASNIVILH